MNDKTKGPSKSAGYVCTFRFLVFFFKTQRRYDKGRISMNKTTWIILKNKKILKSGFQITFHVGLSDFCMSKLLALVTGTVFLPLCVRLIQSTPFRLD